MRQELFAASRILALPTLAVIGVALVAPGRAELALRLYALVVCATAIARLVIALRKAYPAETRLREPTLSAPGRVGPPSLGRVEHEVALGIAGSFDLHYHLVPRLRAVAAGLLRTRRQLSLDDNPAAARSALGEDAWELVCPGRAAPEDRLAKGIAPGELAHVVDALEAL